MNSPEERILTDVFVIGSGIAGGVVALILAENPQVHVTVVTNAPHPWESNTFYAQGGIIGRGPEDSAELLREDLLRAGAGYNNPQAVAILAREGSRLQIGLATVSGGHVEVMGDGHLTLTNASLNGVTLGNSSLGFIEAYGVDGVTVNNGGLTNSSGGEIVVHDASSLLFSDTTVENAGAITFAIYTPLWPAGAIAFLTVGVNLIVDWFLHIASGLKD